MLPSGLRSGTSRDRRGSTDGIPGEHTLWELNYSWTMANRLGWNTVEMDDLAPAGGVHVDALHGQLSVHVRSDVWHRLWLPGGRFCWQPACRWRLRAAAAPSRHCRPAGSVAPIHYGATAIDLLPTMGMIIQGPSLPMISPTPSPRTGSRWRVWEPIGVRDRGQPAGRLLGGRRHTDPAVSTDASRCPRRQRPLIGLTSIRPAPDFRVRYHDAKWWHFQHDAGLVPWISQFGGEGAFACRRTPKPPSRRNDNCGLNASRLLGRGPPEAGERRRASGRGPL